MHLEKPFDVREVYYNRLIETLGQVGYGPRLDGDREAANPGRPPVLVRYLKRDAGVPSDEIFIKAVDKSEEGAMWSIVAEFPESESATATS